MEKIEFLSDRWLAEARRLHSADSPGSSGPQRPIRVNQVVTGVPFGDGTLRVHIDTSPGAVFLGSGHVDQPDVTLTLDYQVAKAIFVDRDPQAPMRAFMTGQLRVSGDLSTLIDVQHQMLNVSSPAVAARIKKMTA